MLKEAINLTIKVLMGHSDYLFARPSFLGGVARLFDFTGTLNSYNVSPSEGVADIRAFQQDWKAIGDDMRRALEVFRRAQE